MRAGTQGRAWARAVGFVRGVQPSPAGLAPRPSHGPPLTWPTRLRGAPLIAIAAAMLLAPGRGQGMRWSAVISGAAATGGGGRANLMNALVTAARPAGEVQFSVTAGAYALPALGVPWQTTAFYTRLFGPVPQAWITWAPTSAWSVRAGQLPSLLGQENVFSFQNVNLERGLLWNALENTFSRAAELDYAHGRWSGALQFGDGFYSRDFGAVSALAAFEANPSDTLSAALLWPNRATPPNRTFHDANARVLDLMWTHQRGRWSWTPYALWFESPPSPTAGYRRPATAAGAAWITTYRLSRAWSLAARLEWARGGTAGVAADAPHQNVLLLGPGVRAGSATVTPSWRRGWLLARAEVSCVAASGHTPQFTAAVELALIR